ncbi:MAG: alpha/beta hydrolase [Cyanobacteria bacterium J06621_11]
MEFYIWKDYRCVYDSVQGSAADSNAPALLLIHPIGVGLSRQFWQPFVHQWAQIGGASRIYNLDLLGCGDSEMPRRAYTPQDWAQQIAYFIEQIAKEPVVLVVQGALLPVAVELMSLPAKAQVKGMVLSGPPAWPLMSSETTAWKTRLAWTLFSSPLGNLFYRYARREAFLKSFSQRQLFENEADVTANWLQMLHGGSREMNSRYAVFSFLAGFWRQDYSGAIAQIQQPVIIVMGETASTIDRKVAKQVDGQKVTDSDATDSDRAETNRKRLQDYLDHFPRARGVSISGRNVLPYESTIEFTQVVSSFMQEL